MTDINSLSNSNSNPTSRRFNPWPLFVGVLLMSFGALFLFSRLVLQSNNWWAIFIFGPSLLFIWGAVVVYYFRGNAFDMFSVRFNLGVGLMGLLLAFIFAFNLNWSIAWTLMLIGPGLVIFLNGFTRHRFGSPKGSAANVLFWLGTSVILLGVTFLLNQLGLINLTTRFGDANWWWPFILIPGVGALVNALAIYGRQGASATANVLLALSGMSGVSAGAEYLGVGWQWRVAVTLILGGLILLVAEIRRK